MSTAAARRCLHPSVLGSPLRRLKTWLLTRPSRMNASSRSCAAKNSLRSSLLDADFYHKRNCDRRYCLIYFILPPLEQNRLSELLRQLFHLPEFKTKAARMGKVVRISDEKIEFWRAGDENRHAVRWAVRPKALRG